MASLHEDALVIDGLVYHADGDVTALKAGGVDAINVTVSHFEADFERACQETARWRRRLADPESGWIAIETAADFDAARAAGKVGAILGWQNTRPVQDELDRLYLFHKLGLRMLGDPEGATALDGRSFPTMPFYGGNPWFLSMVAAYYRVRDSIG